MVTTSPCLHVQGPMEKPSMYMLKALHPICVIIALSSRQVFKPHLKPYTGRTVQRLTRFALTHINWVIFFLRKKREMLEIYKRGRGINHIVTSPDFILCNNNYNRVFFRCQLAINKVNV